MSPVIKDKVALKRCMEQREERREILAGIQGVVTVLFPF
jgi:hypothetical protein